MNRKYCNLPYTEYTTTAFDGNRLPISQIVIHSTVGTVASAIATFSSGSAQTSAHYIVGNDGKLWAGLEEYNVGYHAGNYPVNQRTIGIEHEWYQGMVITDKLYATSAKLVADICKFYGLGCNRGVVKMHKEFVATGCPNLIDIERIVREANVILNPVAPVDYKKLYEASLQKIGDLQATEKRLREEIALKDKAIAERNQTISALNTKLAQIKALCP